MVCSELVFSSVGNGKFRKCIECMYGGAEHALMIVSSQDLIVESLDSTKSAVICTEFTKSSFETYAVQATHQVQVKFSLFLLYGFLRKFNQDGTLYISIHKEDETSDRKPDLPEVTICVGKNMFKLKRTAGGSINKYFHVPSSRSAGPSFRISPIIFSILVLYLAVHGGTVKMKMVGELNTWETLSETGTLSMYFSPSSNPRSQYQVIRKSLKPVGGVYLTKFLKQMACICSETSDIVLTFALQTFKNKTVLEVFFTLADGIQMKCFFFSPPVLLTSN